MDVAEDGIPSNQSPGQSEKPCAEADFGVVAIAMIMAVAKSASRRPERILNMTCLPLFAPDRLVSRYAWSSL